MCRLDSITPVQAAIQLYPNASDRPDTRNATESAEVASRRFRSESASHKTRALAIKLEIAHINQATPSYSNTKHTHPRSTPNVC